MGKVKFDYILGKLRLDDNPNDQGPLNLVGMSVTFAGLPDATDALNVGKIAFLSADDTGYVPTKESGFYISNGVSWDFVNIDLTAVVRAADPTVSDDGTQGHFQGQTWINTSTNSVFISTSVATGAANWLDFSQYSSGYSHTGAFAGKTLSNNYVWEAGEGINYTLADVSNQIFKVFSLDRDVHLVVDQPYWTDPVPGDPTDIGLFAGANLPTGISTLFDYVFDYDTEYPDSVGTGFEGSVGRIDLSQAQVGDLLKVRFDFNVISQIANTTVEPALWYSNRDKSDNITFTFPLTASPIFYGTGTVGKTYLNRIEISAWITSQEDINALVLPAIKSDNPVIIQPLGLLAQIIR